MFEVKANAKSILNGQVGEQLACAQLLTQGYITSVMPTGYPVIDLLVLTKDHQVSKLVQVKYTPKPKPTWVLSSNVETVTDHRLIFVLICRTASQVGYEFYCIPADKVAELVKQRNVEYVAKKRLVNAGYVDNTMRRLELSVEQRQTYRNAFHLFGPPK